MEDYFGREAQPGDYIFYGSMTNGKMSARYAHVTRDLGDRLEVLIQRKGGQAPIRGYMKTSGLFLIVGPPASFRPGSGSLADSSGS